jgi:hypothetical protein
MGLNMENLILNDNKTYFNTMFHHLNYLTTKNTNKKNWTLSVRRANRSLYLEEKEKITVQ